MTNHLKTVFDTVIADDDVIDRLTVLSFARQYPFLHIIACVNSGEAVIQTALQSKPDVLLLDIDMPGLSGLEIRRQLEKVPACIFITSYPDFAVEGFELNALDFLVKPIKQQRFAVAMERLKHFLEVQAKAQLLEHTLGADTIFIKEGTEQVKIQLHEILYLEALKDYTGIITPSKKYCVLSPLGNLLKENTFKQFIRIHRSYAVQKNYISRIAANELEVNGINLPVGRSYKDELQKLFNR
jgi:two-component system, LytTR family, response regulator